MCVTQFPGPLGPTIQCFKRNTPVALAVSPGAPKHATYFRLGVLNDTFVPICINSQEERAVIDIFAGLYIFPYNGAVMAIGRLLNIAEYIFTLFLYPSFVITG
ncbi:hypothetical protein X793_03760 [Dehalococcoides mccartyi CG4]|jgi:hypothetical protein|nr:hypothetical protein X793_03760 [Dehalococcoides mccartyi CG4]